MIIEEYIFKSSNRISDIHTVIWKPEEPKIKGIIQISHGMAEHIYRYEKFAKYMTDNGFIVCGNDHLGHGKFNTEQKGFMGKRNGYKNMVEDLNHVYNYMIVQYPGLPYFLIGHSMGSFLSRYYCTLYGNELDGVIFSGTKGSQFGLTFGLIFSNIMIFLGKGKSTAKFLDKLSFDSYNEKFLPKKTDFDWLCSDSDIVSEYIKDENCGFVFTYYAFRDLFKTLKYISANSFYRDFPITLSTYIFSGTDDPVGNYSKGVKEVYRKLQEAGVLDVSLKLYKGRHEMLNEVNKLEVFGDMLDWIESKIKISV